MSICNFNTLLERLTKSKTVPSTTIKAHEMKTDPQHDTFLKSCVFGCVFIQIKLYKTLCHGYTLPAKCKTV